MCCIWMFIVETMLRVVINDEIRHLNQKELEKVSGHILKHMKHEILCYTRIY